jgi:YfiR/HmsC-like
MAGVRPAGLRRLWWLAAVLWMAASVRTAALQEYDVKAAFLLNFTRFVEWPAAAFADGNAPMTIGIVGEDPFGGVLQSLVKGQTALGRRIEIRSFQPQDTPAGCQVLFFSRSLPPSRVAALFQSLQGQPVLLVGETSDFAAGGGTIGFVFVNKTVRFDVNLQKATQAELKVSSKLLAVARTVLKQS